MCFTLPELLSSPTKKEEMILQEHEKDTQWYYKSLKNYMTSYRSFSTMIINIL